MKISVLSSSFWLLLAGLVVGAPEADFGKKLQPFLENHCLDCHDATTQKGGVRLDTLAPEFGKPAEAARWTAVFDQVVSGAMPPKKKTPPPKPESTALLQWVGSGLLAAEAAQRKTEGAGVVRRLNRVEYENTVRELLGIETELQDILPEDSSLAGFDNVGEAMSTSAVLLERYLEAADTALDAATANKKRSETESGTYQYTPQMIPKYLARWARETPEAMVFTGSALALQGFKPKGEGWYRIQVHASAADTGGLPVAYAVQATNVWKGSRTLGFFEAPAGAAHTVEMMAPLRSTAQLKIAVYPYSLAEAQDEAGTRKPGVAIHSLEIEGPLLPQWPPESHRRLYGDLPLDSLLKVQPASAERLGRYPASQVLTPVSAQPEKDVERLLREFLPRAFRRPVTEAEVQAHLGVALEKMKGGGTYEEAVRLGVKTALCSPSFLFLQETPGRLDGFALASRLSYFLWSSMPDAELLSLAAKGTLAQPATLHAQVERLLRSPKARQFTENFTGQWLGLRDIDATAPDKDLYPEFDEFLQLSMVEETHRFFDEILARDLSVANFIDSPFAMLNGRLAAHYGVPGVKGLEIRRVALPPGSHRGGVLGQGAVLKVTANGTTSSPVVRGAWVMRNIVGRPVPPPPEAVPAIEPDIRGAKSIREQLAKHRAIESCASCHNKMDPLGLALENYDVIGGWRDQYRMLGAKAKAPVKVNGTKVAYALGQPVDGSGTLASGVAIGGIDDLKHQLLADRTNIARCLTEKLLVYATGHPLGFTDRNAVAAIVKAAAAKDYGLRTLVQEVVGSEAFLCK